MNNVNIEFAHIYIDEFYNKDNYVDIFRSVIGLKERLKGSNVTFSVMIDDYNPKDVNLNVKHFLEELDSEGLAPDYVIYESEIAKIAKSVFDLMPDSRLKRSYIRYVSNKNHFPCPFLIATWYLLRLGKIESNNISFIKKSDDMYKNNDMIFNVIQTKYFNSEEKALKIISEIMTQDEIKNKIFEILV